MALPDRSIDPRILACAKEEFLSKGYAKVSLREVCQKAGVTTGALYNRFPNKAALFAAVLAPTLETLTSLSKRIEQEGYACLDKQDLQSVLSAWLAADGPRIR